MDTALCTSGFVSFLLAVRANIPRAGGAAHPPIASVADLAAAAQPTHTTTTTTTATTTTTTLFLHPSDANDDTLPPLLSKPSSSDTPPLSASHTLTSDQRHPNPFTPTPTPVACTATSPIVLPVCYNHPTSTSVTTLPHPAATATATAPVPPPSSHATSASSSVSGLHESSIQSLPQQSHPRPSSPSVSHSGASPIRSSRNGAPFHPVVRRVRSREDDLADVHYNSNAVAAPDPMSGVACSLWNDRKRQRILSNTTVGQVADSRPSPVAQNTALAKHGSSAAKKLFACGRCGKTFGKKNHVARHEAAVHDNIRPFVCETCGFPFQEKRGLLRHYKVHEKEQLALQNGFSHPGSQLPLMAMVSMDGMRGPEFCRREAVPTQNPALRQHGINDIAHSTPYGAF